MQVVSTSKCANIKCASLIFTDWIQLGDKLKALSHGAIFLATCNAILLLGDVKLANTYFYHSLVICSKHIKHSSLIYIS